jgi:peptide/nickel transport system permease protein
LDALSAVLSFGRRKPQLIAGSVILLALVLFSVLGSVLYDTNLARPLSALPDMAPSPEHPLGTESAGRDILAVMITGTPLTLKIGLLAAVIGLLIGTILGFTAGYFGGTIDSIVRGATDMILPVPALAVLVVIASIIRQTLTTEIMALIVASLAWMWPTRTIRAQVLSMRERAYVQVAKLCGLNNAEIVVRELLPNLLPYLAASFVTATGAAVLAAIGLEALGLGPQNEPTLGMTIFWAIYYGALLRGMWWWWAPPIVAIVLLFMGLYFISAALDEFANPRLRRAA